MSIHPGKQGAWSTGPPDRVTSVPIVRPPELALLDASDRAATML